jgi:NAD(P)-dependent dehydrogenase (short-subunit alcohol dehydrogenase family)
MKHVLVTGASRGIGRAVCETLLNAGHRVYGIARYFPQGESHRNFITLTGDLSRIEEFNHFYNVISEHTDHLDAVIHNAGILILKSMEETLPKDFERIFRINVFAVAELTRVLLPLLRKGSHVVNISSVAGLQEYPKIPGLSVYSASKAALIALTESYAVELSSRGIAFNTIAPGGVQTDMYRQAFGNSPAAMTADEIGKFIVSFTLEGHHKYNGKIIPYTGH